MNRKSLHELGMYELNESVEEVIQNALNNLKSNYELIKENAEFDLKFNNGDEDAKSDLLFAQEKLLEIEKFKKKII